MGELDFDTIQKVTWRQLLPGFWYQYEKKDTLLIKEGEIMISKGPTQRAPRTMMGTDLEGRLLIFVIHGFEHPSPGLGATWFEAATWFKGLGAYNALILDDGGSSTAVYDGKIVNDPTCMQTETPICERTVTSIVCITY